MYRCTFYIIVIRNRHRCFRASLRFERWESCSGQAENGQRGWYEPGEEGKPVVPWDEGSYRSWYKILSSPFGCLYYRQRARFQRNKRAATWRWEGDKCMVTKLTSRPNENKNMKLKELSGMLPVKGLQTALSLKKDQEWNRQKSKKRRTPVWGD